MKTLMLVIGVVAALFGLLWIGQGTGMLPYPATSFMVGDMRWTWYGCALAVIGIGLVWYSRR